jgi:hypothetical protein
MATVTAVSGRSIAQARASSGAAVPGARFIGPSGGMKNVAIVNITVAEHVDNVNIWPLG